MSVNLLHAALVALLVAPAIGAAGAPSSLLTLVTASEPGVKLTIRAQVSDESGKPVAGAQLHVTQTDASGRYTPERAMDEAHARLSGTVRSDTRGQFEIRTIRPGGYPKAIELGGKQRKIPAHIHIDVTAPGYASRKLQVVFADDPLLADPYWQDWAKQAGHPIVSVTRHGSTQSATVVVSLKRTTPR